MVLRGGEIQHQLVLVLEVERTLPLAKEDRQGVFVPFVAPRILHVGRFEREASIAGMWNPEVMVRSAVAVMTSYSLRQH
jgi:hypothetical protein